MICYFGPESLVGAGDFGKKADNEAARVGVPLDERNKVLTSLSCSVNQSSRDGMQ